jgi:hypothetical protein
MAGLRALWSRPPARPLAAGLSAGVLLVAWAVPAAAVLDDVALAPPSGPGGTVVSISGSGCRDGASDTAAVTVSAPTLGVDLVLPTDGDGSWGGTFTVPSGAAEGDHLVQAICVRGPALLDYMAVTFTRTADPVAPASSAPSTVPTATTAPATTVAPAGGSSPATTGGIPSTALTTAPSTDAPITLDGTGAATGPASTSAPTTAEAVADESTVADTPTATDGGGPPTVARAGATGREPSASPGAGSVRLLPALLAPAALVAGAAVSWHRRRGRRTNVRADASASVPPVGVNEGGPTSGPAFEEVELAVVLEPAPEPLLGVDLRHGVCAIESAIRAGVPAGVIVQLDAGESACVVSLRDRDLERLVLPLVDNAARAVGNGGMIRIATGRGPCASVDAPDDAEWAVLVVADTGSGIPAEVLAGLRASWSSSGAGGEPTSLLTVHALVAQLGGYLDVSSVPKHGTTVTIALPLHETGPEPALDLDAELAAAPADVGAGWGA